MLAYDVFLIDHRSQKVVAVFAGSNQPRPDGAALLAKHLRHVCTGKLYCAKFLQYFFVSDVVLDQCLHIVDQVLPLSPSKLDLQAELFFTTTVLLQLFNLLRRFLYFLEVRCVGV
ncbi:hypothetical protein D3C76_668760 [compost metagenome]